MHPKVSVQGYKFSSASASIKKAGRQDIAIAVSDVPSVFSATFTQNRVKAAPVLIGKKLEKKGILQAVVANSGNANACTGLHGIRDAGEIVKSISEITKIDKELILPASTGVIGVRLPLDRMKKALPGLANTLSKERLPDFAKAILTTDTREKIAFEKMKLGGKEIQIAGTAKGAGMISPKMATMLAFVFTNLKIEKEGLDSIFKRCVDYSFNRITVDNDTSTNDTALIMANGAAGNRKLTPAEKEKFAQALFKVLFTLAKMIVADGEGATKIVRIIVTGAKSPGDAKRVSYAIANSMLVKTALFGSDPNWGRIAAAAGYSGAAVEQERLDIYFDSVKIFSKGIFCGHKREIEAGKILKQKEFSIALNLNSGDGQFYLLTTDLSYDYIKINADYRS